MKYIKAYENINKPQINDYVIMDGFDDQIGQITYIQSNVVSTRYANNKLRTFLLSDILEFDPTIKVLELKIKQRKYNL
jgi:hypothetical protein